MLHIVSKQWISITIIIMFRKKEKNGKCQSEREKNVYIKEKIDLALRLNYYIRREEEEKKNDLLGIT